MILRQFRPEDEPELREIHQRFGYKWPFPENISSYQVVCDDSGRILMAAGYRMVPEVTLLCDPDETVHPLVKFKGISILHDAIRAKLTSSGQPCEAIAFIAPELKRFLRHLQRHWTAWRQEWPCLRYKEGE